MVYKKKLENTLNMICVIFWMYETDSEVVQEPNSENCLDLDSITPPCKKALVVSDKIYAICNKKFHVGHAKCW